MNFISLLQVVALFSLREVNMENKINKLQQAKMFMDCLANGVDPTNNMNVNSDTFHNEQVVACFRYISDILTEDIYRIKTSIKKNNDFYITDEQIHKLTIYSYNRKVSELANEINRVTAENETKKFLSSWINDWLEAEGYLCKSELKSRIATEKGLKLGITFEHCKRDYDNEYYINFYNAQAQLFIFHNLNKIIAYKNERYFQSKQYIHYIEYPNNISLKNFTQQLHDKCFIMSIGSCDSVSEVGSYMTVLLYKGKSKLLKRSNIPTNSTNKCILTGILDAASAIKSPTDVIILSSTHLGFNTPKSKNYEICQNIYQALIEKSCDISFSVCQGKEYEFYNFVKSFN